LTLTVRPLLVSVHFILNRKLLFVGNSFAFLHRPEGGKGREMCESVNYCD